MGQLLTCISQTEMALTYAHALGLAKDLNLVGDNYHGWGVSSISVRVNQAKLRLVRRTNRETQSRVFGMGVPNGPHASAIPNGKVHLLLHPGMGHGPRPYRCSRELCRSHDAQVLLGSV